MLRWFSVPVLLVLMAGCAVPLGHPVYRVQVTAAGFDPPTLEVPAGATVEWANGESVLQSVTAEDGGWSSGPLFGGEGWSHDFQRSGTYRYYSELDPDLHGIVRVNP